MAKTNIQAFMMLVLGILAILLVIVGAGYGISAYLDAEFGSFAVVAVWFFITNLATAFGVWKLALASFRVGGDAIVDFQAADDRGEVARARVLQEVVKSTWQGERQRYNESPTMPLLPVQQQSALTVDWTQAALPADTEWSVIE